MGPICFRNFAFALFMLVASVVVLPAQTHAQYGSFPCSNGINGPGPGERDLGMGPGGVRMCGESYDAQQQPQQAPQPDRVWWIDGYAAVVGHVDANDYWAAWDVRLDQGGFDGASNFAMNACKAAMGDGCKVMDSARNGSIIVMRTHTGYLYAHYGATVAQARTDADKWCATNNYTCTYYEHITTAAWQEKAGQRIEKAEVYDPSKNNGGVRRNLHGAVAWALDTTKSLGNNVWVSGGKKTQSEAREAALKLCQNDLAKSGGTGKCEIPIAAANSSIIVALDDGGLIRHWSGTDFEIAEKDLSARCKNSNIICTVKFRFDTRKEGDASYDISAASK